MSSATKSVDVNVPINAVYIQWTQFEEFPRFMADIESVHHLDERRLHWKVKIAGVEREFDAAITEQHPEERIACRSVGRMLTVDLRVVSVS